MKKFKALILGAGYRGRAYAQYAQLHPDQLEIAGVADPVQLFEPHFGVFLFVIGGLLEETRNLFVSLF